jgi:putative FmdB family regulatory protein
MIVADRAKPLLEKKLPMPIYEYVCFDCRKRVSVFFRSMRAAQEETPRCPDCDGVRIRRLVSRVAVMKSEDRRLDDMADPSLMAGLEQEDPRALARLMRQMSDETGEPLDAEMNEVLNRLESGESPDAIDAALADMEGEMGGDMDDVGGMGGMDDFGGLGGLDDKMTD